MVHGRGVSLRGAAVAFPVRVPMKPYYQDEAVTIYRGDCREVLPSIAYNSTISDPPYGIDYEHSARAGARIVGDDGPFDPAVFDLSKPAVLWGANNYCQSLPSGGWLVWMKHTDNRFLANWNKSDAELAWTNTTRKVLAHVHLWSGAIRQDPVENGIQLPHPTQKPQALMRWCCAMVPGVIVDPFMGSGTTLRAAKDLGRKAIGIEIEERYCEIAANRMAQEVLAFG